MQASFAELSGDLANLLRYQGFGGTDDDKVAALRWLKGRGIDTTRERLLICPGSHSALFSVLGQVARHGDIFAPSRITYPGIRALAAHLGLRLLDLPTDRHGVDPDAFAPPATKVAPKAIYLNPLLQNPTTANPAPVAPGGGDRGGAALCRQHHEDDAYARICPAPPELRGTRARNHLLRGRGGQVLGSRASPRLLGGPECPGSPSPRKLLRAATVMASPISMRLATRWIMDGTADAIVQFVREESAARQHIVAAMLPAGMYTADPHGFHVWITMPEGWTRSAFASHGRSAGLGVVASDPFCVAGSPRRRCASASAVLQPGSRSRTVWKCSPTRSKARQLSPRHTSDFNDLRA